MFTNSAIPARIYLIQHLKQFYGELILKGLIHPQLLIYQNNNCSFSQPDLISDIRNKKYSYYTKRDNLFILIGNEH